jgi:Zn-dependent protease with chaperone function
MAPAAGIFAGLGFERRGYAIAKTFQRKWAMPAAALALVLGYAVVVLAAGKFRASFADRPVARPDPGREDRGHRRYRVGRGLCHRHHADERPRVRRGLNPHPGRIRPPRIPSMGPFLGSIIAAFMATLAFDFVRPVEPIDRTTPTLLAVGMIVFAWVTSRLHHAPRGEDRAPWPSSSPQEEGRVRPPVWARPFDLFVYALLLFQTDWTTVSREATLDLPLLRHLLTLAPYFLAALVRVDAAVPPEADDAPQGWSRGRIVGFHARLLLIPILPLLLINGVHDTIAAVPAIRDLLAAYALAEYATFALLFIVALASMPKILAWLLRSKPVPPGPLRSSLEADLARQRVRIGSVDEVDTGGLIPNAAYLGLATRLGRIFISDALLGAMPADEVRAVFAHEVAHGTRRHLLWILLLFIGAMFVSYLGMDFLSERTVRVIVGSDASAKVVATTLWGILLGALLILLFGGAAAFVAISRRFEVEADLAASESIGDAELFSRALLRVGALAGKPVDRHGMRHFSIALRTAIVRACAVDAGERGRWLRKIRAPKVAITGLIVLVATGVAWKAPYDVELGHARRALIDAGSDHPRSVTLLREAAGHARAALPHAPVRNHAAEIGIAALMGLSDELLRSGGPGDFDEARAIAQELDDHWPRGDLTGDFNRMLLRLELDAIDPARDLAGLRPGVKAAHDRLQDLLTIYPRNPSIDVCEQELRFLGAAAGAGNGSLDYDAESFESSRLLALARGAKLGGAESREAERALESWSNDAAWRRVVLERALGRKPREVVEDLVAAETRRSTR